MLVVVADTGPIRYLAYPSAAVLLKRPSLSPPEPHDLPPVAFRWLALPQPFEMRHCFALFSQL